jgi:hypothetical protein
VVVARPSERDLWPWLRDVHLAADDGMHAGLWRRYRISPRRRGSRDRSWPPPASSARPRAASADRYRKRHPAANSRCGNAGGRRTSFFFGSSNPGTRPALGGGRNASILAPVGHACPQIIERTNVRAAGGEGNARRGVPLPRVANRAPGAAVAAASCVGRLGRRVLPVRADRAPRFQAPSIAPA